VQPYDTYIVSFPFSGYFSSHGFCTHYLRACSWRPWQMSTMPLGSAGTHETTLRNFNAAYIKIMLTNTYVYIYQSFINNRLCLKFTRFMSIIHEIHWNFSYWNQIRMMTSCFYSYRIWFSTKSHEFFLEKIPWSGCIVCFRAVFDGCFYTRSSHYWKINEMGLLCWSVVLDLMKATEEKKKKQIKR
jgi:hypothetical protein